MEPLFNSQKIRTNTYTILNNVVLINKEYPNVLIKQLNNESSKGENKSNRESKESNISVIYDPYNEKTMSLDIKTEKKTNETNEINGIVYNNPVYFFIYNFNNYYHFMYDTIPYLLNYIRLLKEIPNLKLLINYETCKLFQFNKDILSMFNQVINREDCVYSTMVISDSLTHGGLSNSSPLSEIYGLYSSFSNHIGQLSNEIKSTIDKVYISRRTWTRSKSDNIGTDYTTRRKLVNEDKLVEMLNSYGYKEIFAEDLTLNQKMNLFKNAKSVIGCIGGGMCNLLFSDKNTKVLCIVSPYFLDINKRFKYSMDHTNITYVYDTKLVHPQGKIPLYVRVQLKDGRIGEIIDYSLESKDKKDKYVINVASENVTGFDKIHNIEIHSLDEFKQLDKGLNSPFELDLVKFKSLLKDC